MAHAKHHAATLRCYHCGAENPPKAYCCLSCFKVLRPKEAIPWWRAYIRMSLPMTMLMLFFIGVGLYMFKRWMENIEAQVTMNFKGSDYNLTLTADKKKRKFQMNSSQNPSDDSTPAAASNPLAEPQ